MERSYLRPKASKEINWYWYLLLGTLVGLCGLWVYFYHVLLPWFAAP
jgi:hypothetical protein